MLTDYEIETLLEILPHRSKNLFTEFLPHGYEITTLDTVENKLKNIESKILLGSLITVYDDFADNPSLYNSELLQVLYQIPFEKEPKVKINLNEQECFAVDSVRSMFQKLFSQLKKMPQYKLLINLFKFDLNQFFMANYYSEQLTQLPQLSNQLENKLYLHHNMGIVMAGMIDLMSLSKLKIENLGAAREILLLGQRAGRISNVTTTFEREKIEGDVTNEIPVSLKLKEVVKAKRLLEVELKKVIQKIENQNNCENFNAKLYALGIRRLHNLHLQFKGVI